MMPSEPDDIYYQIFCSANFVQISLLFTVTVFNFYFFFRRIDALLKPRLQDSWFLAYLLGLNNNGSFGFV